MNEINDKPEYGFWALLGGCLVLAGILNLAVLPGLNEPDPRPSIQVENNS